MKIAILYYGQPRYLDNPRPFDAYNRELFTKYNCTNFVHTWYGRDIKEHEVSTWVGTSIQQDPNAVVKIIDMYSPVVLKVEIPRVFEIDPLMKKHIEENFEFNDLNVRNIMSHLYSISEVSKLVREYQMERSEFFDWFVLARTDMVIRGMPDFWKSDNSKLYLPNNHSNFPDTIVAFGQKYLDWACNLYQSSLTTKVLEGIREPTAESFKMQSFIQLHKETDLAPCSMYGDVVRSNR